MDQHPLIELLTNLTYDVDKIYGPVANFICHT